MHHYPNWSYGAALAGGLGIGWAVIELLEMLRRRY